MEKHRKIYYRLRLQSFFRLGQEKLSHSWVRVIVYSLILAGLILAILLLPPILPLDERLERVGTVIGLIVKILTALSLFAALVWAPPFFRDFIAKEHLKDLVKATHEADTKVFREAVALLDQLSMPGLDDGTLPKSDITYFKKAFAQLRTLAFEGKEESATLAALSYRMLRHLEYEYDKLSIDQVLMISKFSDTLIAILNHISFMSSAVIKLPKSKVIRQVPIANVSLKRYVSSDSHEVFKEYPRGVNLASDAPMPLLFFDIINERGTIHLMRAAAMYRSPVPYFTRLLDVKQLYLPPRIVSDQFKFIDNQLFPLTLIGFHIERSSNKKAAEIVKAWYSNLERFFILMKGRNPDRLKGPFADEVMNKPFFKQVKIENIRYAMEETIEMTFSLKEVQRYHQKYRKSIRDSRFRIDALEKAGKDLGDKF